MKAIIDMRSFAAIFFASMFPVIFINAAYDTSLASRPATISLVYLNINSMLSIIHHVQW